MDPLYAALNISKRYGHVTALSDATLSVNPGEVVGLVGDNGAGKSTLVKILSGALKPDSGELILDATNREWSSPLDALHAGVETLYQDSSLAPDLTVSANVFLGREKTRRGLLGKLGFLTNREMDEIARAELEKVGIASPESNRPVSSLSGGQRQAVAIGRAVAWATKVLILDEPTNHLGAQQSAEVLRIIRRASSHGLGVILVSHTLPHILEVTDRIVVLRLGKVVANAPTSEFTADTLVKAITGTT